MAMNVSKPRRLTVGDVMTLPVIFTTPTASYADVERLMTRHHVSAVPVLDAGSLIGIVSEADLLLKAEDMSHPQFFSRSPIRHRRMARKAGARTAQQLMSSPVITVAPEVAVAAAARIMRERSVKRLVVCGSGGVLGIVSRADLINAFVRSDVELHDEVVHAVIEHMLWLDPDRVEVTVDGGMVRLEGRLERRTDAEMLVHLVHGLEGVIGVDTTLSWSFDDRHVRLGHEAFVR